MMWVAMFLSHHLTFQTKSSNPLVPICMRLPLLGIEPRPLSRKCTNHSAPTSSYIYIFSCWNLTVLNLQYTHRNATLRSTFLSILSSHFNQSFSLASLPSTFPTNMIFSKRRTLTTGLTNPVVNVAVGV